jgi:hypothetical protein
MERRRSAIQDFPWRSEARFVLYEKEKKNKIRFKYKAHVYYFQPVQSTPITIFISLLSLHTITDMAVEKSIYV